MLVAATIILCINIILMIVFYRKVSHNFSQNAYRDRIREEVNRLIIDIEHESDHAVTILEDKILRIGILPSLSKNMKNGTIKSSLLKSTGYHGKKRRHLPPEKKIPLPSIQSPPERRTLHGLLPFLIRANR